MKAEIFICYDEDDEDHAERLQKALSRRQVGSFSQVHDLQPGDLWDEVVPARLHEARLVVVLVSARWPSRGKGRAAWYPSDEIVQAVELAKADPDNGPIIVPVRVPGCEAERVPHGLSRIKALKMRSDDFAPIAERLARVLGKAPDRMALLDLVVEETEKAAAEEDAGA